MATSVQSYAANPPAMSRLARWIRKYWIAYLFIAVPVIWNIVFLLIPMLVSLWWSLNDYSGLKPPVFVGLQNYIQLLTRDPIFIKSFVNTTEFVLLGMGIGPTLGLLTALMLNQNVKFQSVFRTAYFLPVMTSLVVVSTIWIMLYNHNGLFNVVILALGLPRVGFLSNPQFALLSGAAASIWQGFGFETVVFLAALQAIPKELYEAAEIDGANAYHKFLAVTLPALRPVILFAYIVGIIGSYQVFDQVFVMTKGGPLYASSTIVYYLFTKFQDLRLGYASAIAYILFAVLVIFSYIQMRFFGEQQ
jgi:ABC-type sugar transport system permease subunit